MNILSVELPLDFLLHCILNHHMLPTWTRLLSCIFLNPSHDLSLSHPTMNPWNLVVLSAWLGLNDLKIKSCSITYIEYWLVAFRFQCHFFYLRHFCWLKWAYIMIFTDLDNFPNCFVTFSTRFLDLLEEEAFLLIFFQTSTDLFAFILLYYSLISAPDYMDYKLAIFTF